MSITVVTPPSPSPFIPNFNRMNNLSNEQNNYLERKYPFLSHLIFFIFLQLALFLYTYYSQYFCVTFTTNLTLYRQKKDVSRLPQSVPQSVTLASLLLVESNPSAESPENYLSILIILPDFYYRSVFSLNLKLVHHVIDLYVYRS